MRRSMKGEKEALFLCLFPTDVLLLNSLLLLVPLAFTHFIFFVFYVCSLFCLFVCLHVRLSPFFTFVCLFVRLFLSVVVMLAVLFSQESKQSVR